MNKVFILGANGQIARVATQLFLARTDAQLTLYLRSARRLKSTGAVGRIRVVEGDVLDADTLESAMKGQDLVYANLAGQLEQQAHAKDATVSPKSVADLVVKLATTAGLESRGSLGVQKA